MHSDIKPGDLVFHTRRRLFGRSLTHPKASNLFHETMVIRAEVLDQEFEDTEEKFVIWYCHNLIKIENDTPENRLFLTLKYA